MAVAMLALWGRCWRATPNVPFKNEVDMDAASPQVPEVVGTAVRDVVA